MKVVKVVTQSHLVHASCLDCVTFRSLGKNADADAYKHADENDGHRVHVTETSQLIYERRERGA